MPAPSKKTLSPAEVHNVAFKKPPIGKRGYDEEEVDYFLDVVETELSRLIEENQKLQNSAAPHPLDESQLAQATDQALVAENQRLNSALESTQDEHRQLSESHSNLQDANGGLQEALRAAEQRAESAQRDAEAARAALAAGGGGEPADHHQQAVKVLALAQQTADQHLSSAQAEADKTTSDARSAADQLHQQSSAEAQRRVDEAQARADQLRRESEERAAKTINDSESHAASVAEALEGRKSALEKRLSELGTFEREYRSRLKSYLESQLRDLTHGGDDAGSDNYDGQQAAQPADVAQQPQ